MKFKKTILQMLLIFFLFIPHAALSQKQASAVDLSGLSEFKAYFDIKADSAAKVEKRLEWINDIYLQMNRKGVKAEFVISFRSQASFYVTQGDEDLDEEDIPAKRKIKKWLKQFAERGVAVEQCGLSAKLYEIEPEDFLPEITVVENGYVAMITYQNRGYAYVPM